MKIKDILGEDGVTIAAVNGDKAKLSNGQEVDAKTLAPDQKHPGQYTMPEMDPTAIKPGAVVSTGDQPTSEEYEEEGAHNVSYHAFASDPDFAPHETDDKDTTFHKALNFLTGKVHPADMEYHAHHLTKHHHGDIDDRDLDEVHHDLVSQGNHDVGGDATDNFIDQVRDRGFERAQLGQGQSTRSPIGGKLKESDELYKWLTIAGVK
jgi:hypothetical protein